jgi:hypothetical protein
MSCGAGNNRAVSTATASSFWTRARRAGGQRSRNGLKVDTLAVFMAPFLPAPREFSPGLLQTADLAVARRRGPGGSDGSKDHRSSRPARPGSLSAGPCRGDGTLEVPDAHDPAAWSSFSSLISRLHSTSTSGSLAVTSCLSSAKYSRSASMCPGVLPRAHRIPNPADSIVPDQTSRQRDLPGTRNSGERAPLRRERTVTARTAPRDPSTMSAGPGPPRPVLLPLRGAGTWPTPRCAFPHPRRTAR